MATTETQPQSTSHQPFTPEPTFRNYSSTQAQEYAESRPTYSKNLIDHIITSHKSTGGSLDTVLDLGCGPGVATRDLAQHFTHAIGMDPSSEMISTAHSLGGSTKSSEPIRYLVGEAESCSGIPDQSVDLITAATCAHWFDMQRFWPTAARILKPGGSVAIFIIVHRTIHPDTPHREEMMAIMHELRQVALKDYKLVGNDLARENYKTLVLPWDLKPKVKEFEEGKFVRRTWNENGEKEEGVEGGYFAGVLKVRPGDVEKRYGTSSAVTRWRQAHPDLAGTDTDVVKVAFEKVMKLFEGEEKLVSFVGATTLLFLKRS